MITLLTLFGFNLAYASNTILVCNIPQGAFGNFFVEQWNNDEITKYSVSFVNGDGEVIEKGFLSNVIKDKGNLTGIIFADDSSINGYLNIVEDKGFFYAEGAGAITNSPGLNLQFALQNCKNPQH